MMAGEIPWFKQKMVIREHNATGSPSSEIKITQFANSLAGVQERFIESASVKNITGLPQYSGPNSNGKWTVSWRERRQAGYENTAKFGWYSKKKKT